MSKFKLALIQMYSGKCKLTNISHAVKKINEATSEGAKLITLPECFNYFPKDGEPVPGPSTDALSKAAKDNSVYICGGSISEKDGEKVYNTCTIFNPSGDMIAKYRKVHLFDIDVPGEITYKESDVLSPGNQFTMFKTPFCTVGVGLCYDIRFAEMTQIYANLGCHLVLYPGAFNMTTGPAHLEALQKARALDNQVYVATASLARDFETSYVSWGHSAVTDPWGDIISQTDDKESIVYADIDIARVEEVRKLLPLSSQKRYDLYQPPFSSVDIHIA